MENNTDTAKIQTPVQQPTVPTVSSTNGVGAKIILIAVMLALIIGTGGYIYFMQNNKTNLSEQQQEEDRMTVNLEGEVNAIDIGSDDEGFLEIDQGLQNL